MATYTKTTDFLAKDYLPLNNAAKYVKGSEIDTEYNNIATADADNMKKSAMGTGVETFLGIPSSANLAAAVTDETGSGLLVFNSGPILTAPLLTGGSFKYTLTGGSLAADRILNVPVTTATDTLSTLGLAQTWTAAQTFRAASAVRSEAASTQDAMVLAGRAGGTGSYAVTLTPTTLTASRIATFPDADFSVGYLNVPQNSQSTAYTAVLADAGKHIYITGTATLTIPTNASVAFPVGTAITFINNAAAETTFTTTSLTVYKAGTSAAWASGGTLSIRGMCTFVKVATDTWFVNGTTLS